MIPVVQDNSAMSCSKAELLELQAQGPPEGFAQTFFVGDDRVIPQNATLIASPLNLHFILLRVLFDEYVFFHTRKSSAVCAGTGAPSSSGDCGTTTRERQKGYGCTEARWEGKEFGRDGPSLPSFSFSFRSSQELLLPLPPLSSESFASNDEKVEPTKGSLSPSVVSLQEREESQREEDGAPAAASYSSSPAFACTAQHSGSVSYLHTEESAVQVEENFQQHHFLSAPSRFSSTEKWGSENEFGILESAENIYEDGESFFRHIREDAAKRAAGTSGNVRGRGEGRGAPVAGPKREREEGVEEEREYGLPQHEKSKKREDYTHSGTPPPPLPYHYSQNLHSEATKWWRTWNNAMGCSTNPPTCHPHKGHSHNGLQHFFQAALPPLLEDFCDIKIFKANPGAGAGATNSTSTSSATPSTSSSPYFSTVATMLEDRTVDGEEEGGGGDGGVTKYFKPSLIKAAMWVGHRVDRVQHSVALHHFLQVPLPGLSSEGDDECKRQKKEEKTSCESCQSTENEETKRVHEKEVASHDANSTEAATHPQQEQHQSWNKSYEKILQKAALGLVSEYVPSSLLSCMQQALMEKIREEEDEMEKREVKGSRSDHGTEHGSNPVLSSHQEEVCFTDDEKKTASSSGYGMTYTQCLALLTGGDVHVQSGKTKVGEKEGNWKFSPSQKSNREEVNQYDYFMAEEEKGAKGTVELDNLPLQSNRKKNPLSTSIPALPSLRRFEKGGKPKGTPTLDVFFGSPSSSTLQPQKKK